MKLNNGFMDKIITHWNYWIKNEAFFNFIFKLT